MERKVLKEKNEYKDGRRINTQTVRIQTTLSEDVAQQANYMNALAVHIGTIDKLKADMPNNMEKQEFYRREIERIKSEVMVLKEAIKIQEAFIKGYDNGDK